MNVDDKPIETVTNKDLARGDPNRFIERKAMSESGAGANAVSALNTGFVATDPLSELVWSPQKGLSLRCADGSFSKKKFSLRCGAGTSNMGSGINSNEYINKENLVTSAAACDVPRNSSAGFRCNDAGTMALSASNADESKMDVAQNDPISEEPTCRVGVVGNTEHTLGMEIVLTSDVQPENQCGAYDACMQNVLPSGKGLKESPSSAEKESKNDVYMGPSSICPLQKLESSDENDFRPLLTENACCAAAKIVAAESAHVVGNNSQRDSVILCGDKTLEANFLPKNSRIQRNQKKGKAKALSDGNANGRMLDEEDDSHESVESCNTSRLVSAGKRPRSFEQQLIVGSKKVKRQIQERPSSTSFFKQDSSFKSWISNMMKGFEKPNKDEAPSLQDRNYGHESPCQNLVTCNRNHDPGCRAVGFQSMFRSLYCPKTRTQEVKTLSANHQTDESKELNLDTKVCDIDATPTAFHKVTGDFCKSFMVSSEKFNESASCCGTGSIPQPKDTCLSNPSIQEINRTGSVEKQNSLEYCNEREGKSSNSCGGKGKTSTCENTGSESQSEGKTTNNFAYKSDPLASLWVTRFTPKPYIPFSNQDLCDKSTGEALYSSIDSMKLKPQLNDHSRSCDGQKIMEGRKHFAEDPLQMETFENSADSPFGFFNMKSQHDEKSICKMNPILPSPQLRNSEVMASVFARRLGALKQIIPLDVTNNAASASWTCFFCGLKGHNLRNCPKVSCSELEDVLRNISSYICAEEQPCLCIRCFQPDHWAVACPNASLKIRDGEEHNASVVDECAHNNSQLGATNQDIANVIDGKDRQLRAGAVSTDFDGNDPGVSNDRDFERESDEAASSRKLEGNADSFERGIAPSCIKNKLKENKIMHLCDFSNKHIPNVPKGILDAVKMLWLSRTDILKFMKSGMPLSHLDGFFLRLRLGRWEEGLRGTGYHVACITGVQRESLPRKFGTSIAVNVGGIKCFVDSKYISNQYFLEDELMAWWSATLNSGSKIPSEEYLRQKVKEKQMLDSQPKINFS